jgi:hypothetical protein
VVGGPVGAGLGSLAAGALSARQAPAAAARPVPAAPAPSTAVTPAGAPSAPAQPSPVVSAPAATPLEVPPPASGGPSSPAGGSAAAAQGLVLTQQPDVLQALLATALGQYGRRRVSGVPVAQLLALLSQVLGQAAADADELMYLEQDPEAAEGVLDDVPEDRVQSLYTDLLGADNLELAEAAGWDRFDR